MAKKGAVGSVEFPEQVNEVDQFLMTGELLTEGKRLSDTVRIMTTTVKDANGVIHTATAIILVDDVVLSQDEFGKTLAVVGGPRISRKTGKGYMAGSVLKNGNRMIEYMVQAKDVSHRDWSATPKAPERKKFNWGRK